MGLLRTLLTPKTLVAGALALAFAVAGCSHLPSTTDTTPATGVKEMAEAPLTIQTYNPGEEAIFAVSSTLVQGRKDAILIDAQFSAEDARKLAAQIRMASFLPCTRVDDTAKIVSSPGL